MESIDDGDAEHWSVLHALACTYIGDEGPHSWWQSWAINSDTAGTHNSLGLKTAGQIL